MKILVFEIFEKGQILRPFSGLAPSKLKFFSIKFNGSICAYRVLYLPIFRGIEGGWNPTPSRSLWYRKKRDPERVKHLFLNYYEMILLLSLFNMVLFKSGSILNFQLISDLFYLLTPILRPCFLNPFPTDDFF